MNRSLIQLKCMMGKRYQSNINNLEEDIVKVLGISKSSVGHIISFSRANDESCSQLSINEFTKTYPRELKEQP